LAQAAARSSVRAPPRRSARHLPAETFGAPVGIRTPNLLIRSLGAPVHAGAVVTDHACAETVRQLSGATQCRVVAVSVAVTPPRSALKPKPKPDRIARCLDMPTMGRRGGPERRLHEGGYFTMANPPRRVNFVDGLLLTAADLAAEQEYHRGMRYLHNRLHCYGTVFGMEVVVTDGEIRVSPGMGIDVLGREIVVTAPLTLHLEPHRNTRQWVRDLVILWREAPECPVPAPDGGVDSTRWVEQPELVVVARGRAAPEGLVLARLTRTSGRAVDVNTSVRRPLSPA
jgi:hypothetical protein